MLHKIAPAYSTPRSNSSDVKARADEKHVINKDTSVDSKLKFH